MLPNESDADIIGYALKFLLDRRDVLRKSTSTAEAGRVTKAATRRMVLKRTRGKCAYIDPCTGQSCGSTYQIQIDHIRARALGGEDNMERFRRKDGNGS